MGLFKKWFGGAKAAKARVLERPAEMAPGDILQFANHFGLPADLRDQAYRVVGVGAYQFEHGFEPAFELEGASDGRLSLTIETDAGVPTLVFSRSISRAQVESVFNLDEFSAVFSGDAVTLPVQDAAGIGGLEDWLAETYHQQVAGERGYYYDEDRRGSGPSDFEGDGEPFDYYQLLAADEARGVEIEVFSSGETEVSLSLFLTMDMIAGLWPAEQ